MHTNLEGRGSEREREREREGEREGEKYSTAGHTATDLWHINN